MDNKKESIVLSTTFLIGLTIVVKAIGFLKQAVISYTYGTSLDMDIYLIVSSFIDELGVMFFTSISINLVTVYDREKEKSGKRASDRVAANSLLVVTFFSAVLALLLCLFADSLALILAPGLSKVDRNVLAQYIKRLSFLLVNISVSNICIGILNAEKNFLIAKSIGIIQSFCIILACFGLAKKIGIDAIYLGFSVYFILENIFLLVHVFKRVGFHPMNPLRDQGIRRLLTLSVPLFLSNAIIQINAMVDKAIASRLDAGSVSSLSYGSFLFQTVHSIIIGSITTVLLSYFSEFAVKGEYKKIIENIRKCSLIMILILMPVTIICLVNSEHIVSLIYKRGAFDKASVITTSRAFIGYIIGILFIAFRDIFIQVLYAFQKTKEAMINGIAGVAINIIFSLLLSRFYGVFGITIADSIAYIAVVFIGFSMTIEVLPEVKNILNRKEVVDFFLAGVLSFILGLIVKGFVQDIQVYLGMIINVISILIMYIAILLLTKNSAIGMVWSLIRR
jgi:putative peptidoglycan lipid II flippase